MTERKFMFMLDEAQYVELLAALELASRAAGLVEGSDSAARQSTIDELIEIVTVEPKERPYEETYLEPIERPTTNPFTRARLATERTS